MTSAASPVAAALAALPDKSDEDWRHTDLAPLKARAWTERAPETVALAFDDETPVTKVVPLDGGPDGARLVTHRIVLKKNQRATLVLHECQRDGQSLGGAVPEEIPRFARDDTTARDDTAARDVTPPPTLFMHNLEIELAEGAALTLYRIQQPGPATTLISRLDARLARDARFECVGLYAGGVLVRNDLNVALDAPGAEAGLHGVLLPGVGEHLDVHTRLDHRAPHGRSREMFRCIVPAKARAIFNGKVIVRPGAAKTDSEQHVDSLLLAPGAEVNAKPELQIDADDVKCAHGATCGQLDEDAIYYLRTRGLDLPSARNVLLYTFAREVLARIGDPPARQLAEQALLARLPGAGALGDLA